MTFRSVLAVVVAVLVGQCVLVACGSTVTVTRTVRDKPCETVKRMTRCITDIARFTATQNDRDPSGVRVKCDRADKGFACIVRAPSDFGVICATYPVIVTPTVGIPWPQGGDLIDPSVCDKAFGAA